MATEPTKPEQDPAEGSREVVERELKREEGKEEGQGAKDQPGRSSDRE